MTDTSKKGAIKKIQKDKKGKNTKQDVNVNDIIVHLAVNGTMHVIAGFKLATCRALTIGEYVTLKYKHEEHTDHTVNCDKDCKLYCTNEESKKHDVESSSTIMSRIQRVLEDNESSSDMSEDEKKVD